MGIKSGGVARQKLGYDASKYPGVAKNGLFTPSYANVPVVPHKAVAEVSKIGNL